MDAWGSSPRGDELTLVINKMTDDERLILSEYADTIIKKRNMQKVHTKAELIDRAKKTNKILADGGKLKTAKTFLAEIREGYAI